MHQALIDRMQSDAPKKILACDGGGIRGLLSVEMLAKLESDLRVARGKSGLVLADFFDFVCGTSTGAMIAACIAAGMSMGEIRKFYVDSGAQMFDKASIFKRLQYKYDKEPLALTLQHALDKALKHRTSRDVPHATLGSTGLRSLLMMVMRNHSTDSPWPVCNNPRARYNQPQRKDCNLHLPLWQLLRASTAAPTFFRPRWCVSLRIRPTSTSSSSSMAASPPTTTRPSSPSRWPPPPYAIDWPTGQDRMLIVSVGTGSAADARPDLEAGDMNLIHHATTLPGALMNAASAGWDMALPHPRRLPLRRRDRPRVPSHDDGGQSA